MQELLDQLSVPESHASRILERFVHLIQTRTRHRAFHPASAQRVIVSHPSIFTVLRTAPGRDEVVLALTNVTSTAQELLLPLAELGMMHPRLA